MPRDPELRASQNPLAPSSGTVGVWAEGHQKASNWFGDGPILMQSCVVQGAGLSSYTARRWAIRKDGCRGARVHGCAEFLVGHDPREGTRGHALCEACSEIGAGMPCEAANLCHRW
eukprot:6949355-Pyramimonas_sp.AAC.1